MEDIFMMDKQHGVVKDAINQIKQDILNNRGTPNEEI